MAWQKRNWTSYHIFKKEALELTIVTKFLRIGRILIFYDYISLLFKSSNLQNQPKQKHIQNSLKLSAAKEAFFLHIFWVYLHHFSFSWFSCCLLLFLTNPQWLFSQLTPMRFLFFLIFKFLLLLQLIFINHIYHTEKKSLYSFSWLRWNFMKRKLMFFHHRF